MIKEGQEKLAGVYKIWHESQPKYVYIGSTDVDLNRRFGKHLSELRRKQHHNKFMQNVFNKYGEDGLVCEIFEESLLVGKELRALEQKHIDEFVATIGRSDLMNGSLTAATPLDDPEVIARKVAGVKKAYENEDVLRRARENMRRVANDPIHKAKRLENLLKTCAKKTQARQDAKKAKEDKEFSDWKDSVWGSPVMCMDDGNIFDNAREAVEYYGICQPYTGIIRTCLGENSIFQGRRWEFLDESLRPDRTFEEWRETKRVTCVDSGMIFDSIRDASRWLVGEGLSKTSDSAKNMISDSCQYTGRRAAGLTFVYTDIDHTKANPPSQRKLTDQELLACRKKSGDKLRERMKDPKNIEYHTKKLLEANVKLRKPVLCIETNQRHESVSDAARWIKANTKYNGTSGRISAACNGKRPTAYGYHWRYLTTNDSSDTTENPQE